MRIHCETNVVTVLAPTRSVPIQHPATSSCWNMVPIISRYYAKAMTWRSTFCVHAASYQSDQFVWALSSLPFPFVLPYIYIVIQSVLYSVCIEGIKINQNTTMLIHLVVVYAKPKSGIAEPFSPCYITRAFVENEKEILNCVGLHVASQHPCKVQRVSIQKVRLSFP